MNHRPWTVTLTAVLILLNTLIWLILGIIIAVNAHPALPVPPLMKGIMATISILMALILLGLWIFLLRGNRIAYYLTLAFFLLTATLTILDDVGVADLVVLALNIVPVVLLILDRKWYFRPRVTTQPQGVESSQ
ncbi:MAG: hypothetical protein C3F13_13520 [Anaerolineales bacterium]|nr:hypothetical protein [Anaerolineae bacterium]PWB51456.1 MAG: hypothetical protein C3F13_13520 [Anaerolineales bacterium]